MNEISSGRARSWNVYTTAATSSSSDRSPSQLTSADREGPWRGFGTSMNAISFGFVATAILISMFLIMAIFEHLFRPDPSSSSFDSPRPIHRSHSGSASAAKLADQATSVPITLAPDFSVVMPGEQLPTYIAQPAPLPCRREGVRWPAHDPPLIFR